jgi:hypothetical protein
MSTRYETRGPRARAATPTDGSMKTPIKSLLSSRFPGLFQVVRARRPRALNQRAEERWACVALTRKVVDALGPQVRSGPFAGLRFSPRTFERHITPELFGAYESELHPVWDRVLRSADMLVELREEPAPGVTERLIRRSEPTDSYRLVDAAVRTPGDFPAAGFLSDREQQMAVSDLRPEGQQRLLLESRRGS